MYNKIKNWVMRRPKVMFIGAMIVFATYIYLLFYNAFYAVTIIMGGIIIWIMLGFLKAMYKHFVKVSKRYEKDN